jgi:O-antigen/teichoic acid export membrane protein
MKKFAIEYIKNHDLIRHNMVFFFGSLCIAAFNYLYYPVVSRMVSVSDFGQIQAIISIFMQLGILLTAFGYVVTHIINNEKSRDSSRIVILQIERVTLIIASVVLVFLCLSGYFLRSSLQFTSVLPFILVGLLVILNVPSASRTYILQGLKRLKEVSLSGILFTLGKLILSVILIKAGFSVVAVMVAYILAQTLTLLYLQRKTKNDFPGIRESIKFIQLNPPTGSQKLIIKKELIYGGAIIILLFSVTLLYSFDVVVARLFLSPENAGAYSGISAIARIVYFITASVAGVLIATVKLQDSYNKSRKILVKSFGIVALIGGAAALVFALLPNISVKILLGSNYEHVAYLLPIMGLLMLICSFNNLLVCFQIARRQYRAIFATLIGLSVMIIFLAFKHNSLSDIISGYLISNIVTFVTLLAQILKRGSADNKNENL